MQDAGTLSSSAVTLEQILEEKRTFDVSTAFEKLGLEDESKLWATPGAYLILDHAFRLRSI